MVDPAQRLFFLAIRIRSLRIISVSPFVPPICLLKVLRHFRVVLAFSGPSLSLFKANGVPLRPSEALGGPFKHFDHEKKN